MYNGATTFNVMTLSILGCSTVIGLDGVTNAKYKLLRFIQLTIFLQKEEGTSLLPGLVLQSNTLFMADPLPFCTFSHIVIKFLT